MDLRDANHMFPLLDVYGRAQQFVWYIYRGLRCVLDLFCLVFNAHIGAFQHHRKRVKQNLIM